MSETRRPVTPNLRHIGLAVFDMDTMIEFYGDMLGLKVTDRGVSSAGIEVTFLSRDPSQHHQLVLLKGRPPGSASTVRQLAFQLDSLTDLLEYSRFLTQRDVRPSRVLDHGNAWSIYFEDPEQNMIEVYCDSPWYCPQPCGVPLDLDRPEQEIRAATEAMVKARPRSMPVEEWRARFDASIGGT